MAFFESAFVYHLIANGLNMLLVEGSISKCGNSSCHCHWQGRNQGVSVESGSFSVDQFCEYVVYIYMREIKVVGIVNSWNRLLWLNMAGVYCGGGRMWCEQY